MKKIFTFIAISFLLASCYDDHSEVIPGQDFIPDEILAEIRENGQPIFEGLNPPDVTGEYLLSPLTLQKSNFDDSYKPGKVFANQTTMFSDLDPKSLTLRVDIEQAGNLGEGFGSFISGNGNDFTIYVKIAVTEEDGHQTVATEVYSGTLVDGGIKNLYLSYFMIDDGGDPDGDLIEIGQGRLFRDGDGFSERIP